MSLRYVPSELEQRAEQLNVLCKEKQPELPEWIDTTLGSDCHVCIQMRGVGHNYKFPEDTTWRRLMACLGEEQRLTIFRINHDALSLTIPMTFNKPIYFMHIYVHLINYITNG